MARKVSLFRGTRLILCSPDVPVGVATDYPCAIELDVDAAQLSPAVDSATPEQRLRQPGFRLDDELAALERQYIEAALRLGEGNLSKAARLLGVSRKKSLGVLTARADGLGADVVSPPSDRLEMGVALATWAMMAGAQIIRAHDVRPHVEAALAVAAARSNTPTPAVAGN